MTDDTTTVVELRQWHTAAELADRLDVSQRTVYRRLKRGTVEKRATPEGTRYRVATTPADGTDTSAVSTDSHDTDTDTDAVSSPRESTDSTDTSAVSNLSVGDTSAVSELVELVREQGDRIARLERKVGGLEADNARLRDALEAAEADAVDDTSDTSADASEARDEPTAAELVDELRRTADPT